MTGDIMWRGQISTKKILPRIIGTNLWGWYDEGGIRHVAAYLAELDISTFDSESAAAEDTGILGHR